MNLVSFLVKKLQFSQKNFPFFTTAVVILAANYICKGKSSKVLNF